MRSLYPAALILVGAIIGYYHMPFGVLLMAVGVCFIPDWSE